MQFNCFATYGPKAGVHLISCLFFFSSSSVLVQETKQLVAALSFEVLFDLGAFLLATRHFHTFDCELNNPLQDRKRFVLLLDGCILDETLCGRVAYIHEVRLVFVWFHVVCNNINEEISIRATPDHLDVWLGAAKRCEIVGHDLCNFREKLTFAYFGHFTVFDGEVKDFFIGLLGKLLDHTIVVFEAILELHWSLDRWLLLVYSDDNVCWLGSICDRARVPNLRRTLLFWCLTMPKIRVIHHIGATIMLVLIAMGDFLSFDLPNHVGLRLNLLLWMYFAAEKRMLDILRVCLGRWMPFLLHLTWGYTLILFFLNFWFWRGLKMLSGCSWCWCRSNMLATLGLWSEIFAVSSRWMWFYGGSDVPVCRGLCVRGDVLASLDLRVSRLALLFDSRILLLANDLLSASLMSLLTMSMQLVCFFIFCMALMSLLRPETSIVLTLIFLEIVGLLDILGLNIVLIFLSGFYRMSFSLSSILRLITLFRWLSVHVHIWMLKIIRMAYLLSFLIILKFMLQLMHFRLGL